MCEEKKNMQHEEIMQNKDQDLHKHDSRYETIFRNSPVAIMLTNEYEQIIDWNNYTEQLLGWTMDDLFMKPVNELYPSEEWDKIRNQNVRQKGIHHHIETKMYRKEKEPLDVAISLSVIKDTRGNIKGSIGVIKDISQKIHAEQRLQSLLENTNDSIYIVDKNHTYLMVNQELLQRLQLSKNDVIGKTFDALHTPEETLAFSQKIDGVFTHAISAKEEHKSEKLGQWFLRTYSPIKDRITNETVAVAVVSKDITEMKQTESDLKESEENYRLIFENSAIAIMKSNEKEQIISWNNYTERMLGWTKEDLFMKPVHELYPSEEWEKIRNQNVRQKGIHHHIETKMYRKDQEPLDVAISLSVQKNQHGEVIGSIGVIKDISEQKKAQEKMRYEHSLFQSLLNSTPDSVYFKNTENKFVLVNTTKAHNHDLKPDQLIGKTDFDFMPPDQAQKATDDDNKVLQTQEPIIDHIEKLTTNEGEEKWLSVTKLPWYDANHTVIGTMGISRDVTKRIKGQKETEKYKKVAIGQNMRMIELRDKVKDLIDEMENQ